MKNYLNKILLFTAIISSFVMIRCTENHVLPTLGTIFVTSDPLGAEIFLDGENTGKVTPDSLVDLLTGDYQITLKRNEFVDSSFTVNVNNTETRSFDLFLNESDPEGEISLTSSPSGVMIYLEGVNTNQTTPATFSNLERGTYNFSLRLNLYDNSNFEIVLDKDESVEKNTNMIIAGSSGSLFINSVPEGAKIYLDNFDTGLITPSTIEPLAVTNYEVKLTLADYKDSVFTTTLTAGQLTSEVIELKELLDISATVNPENSGTVEGAGGYVEGERATLRAIPNTGYRFVRWTEGGSNVSNNEEYSFTVTEDRQLVANFTLKEYDVTVSSSPGNGGSVEGEDTYKHGETATISATANDGYKFVNWTENSNVVSTDSSFNVVITSDRDFVANFVEIGNLTVNSFPEGANIYFGDNPTGEQTPYTFLDILAGQYSVTLKLEDFADATVNANVNSGQTTDLGIINLIDTTSAVDVEITYEVKSDNRIEFTFVFNQGIRFQTLNALLPDNTPSSQEYNGQMIPAGVGLVWVYAQKIIGNWRFNFIGNKVRGLGSEFNFQKIVQVE